MICWICIWRLVIPLVHIYLFKYLKDLTRRYAVSCFSVWACLSYIHMLSRFESSLSDSCLLCYRLYIALVYILFWPWTLNLQHSPPLEDLQRIALPCNVEFFHFFFSGVYACPPWISLEQTSTSRCKWMSDKKWHHLYDYRRDLSILMKETNFTNHNIQLQRRISIEGNVHGQGVEG